jgi:hypothetical protein
VKENGANCGYCLLYKRRENWITVLLEERKPNRERNGKGKQRGRKTQTKEQKKRICAKKSITRLTLKISIIIRK